MNRSSRFVSTVLAVVFSIVPAFCLPTLPSLVNVVEAVPCGKRVVVSTKWKEIFTTGRKGSPCRWVFVRNLGCRSVTLKNGHYQNQLAPLGPGCSRWIYISSIDARTCSGQTVLFVQ